MLEVIKYGFYVGIKNYNYFIPISSAKEKHKKWKNVSDEHFLIYEVISNSITIDRDIYKYYSDREKMHILSILDIKKMIPVLTDCYERIDFNKLEDIRYKDLFQAGRLTPIHVYAKNTKRPHSIYYTEDIVKYLEKIKKLRIAREEYYK